MLKMAQIRRGFCSYIRTLSPYIVSRFKNKADDPGGTARYYAKGGLGWYTYIWCGGCVHTAQPCNVNEARRDGWAKRAGWGWLCAECLVRLRFVPGPVPA